MKFCKTITQFTVIFLLLLSGCKMTSENARVTEETVIQLLNKMSNSNFLLINDLNDLEKEQALEYIANRNGKKTYNGILSENVSALHLAIALEKPKYVIKFAKYEKLKKLPATVLLYLNQQKTHATELDEDTPLLYAIKIGNIESIKILVQNGFDVNYGGKYNWTPLHQASEKGDVSIVKFLLEQGATLTKTIDNEITPLHWAAYKGNLKTAELLLNNDAEINTKDVNGQTPLHYAVISDNFEMVKLLVEHGANVNAKDYGPNDEEIQDYELMSKIGIKPIDPNIMKGRTPIFWAKNDNIKHYLINKNATFQSSEDAQKNDEQKNFETNKDDFIDKTYRTLKLAYKNRPFELVDLPEEPNKIININWELTEKPTTESSWDEQVVYIDILFGIGRHLFINGINPCANSKKMTQTQELGVLELKKDSCILYLKCENNFYTVSYKLDNIFWIPQTIKYYNL